MSFLLFLHLHCCVFGGQLEQLLYCCTSTASTVSCLLCCSFILSPLSRSSNSLLPLRVLSCLATIGFEVIVPPLALVISDSTCFIFLCLSPLPFDYHVLMTRMASGAQMKREIKCSWPTPLPHRHTYLGNACSVFIIIISLMPYVRKSAC